MGHSGSVCIIGCTIAEGWTLPGIAKAMSGWFAWVRIVRASGLVGPALEPQLIKWAIRTHVLQLFRLPQVEKRYMIFASFVKDNLRHCMHGIACSGCAFARWPLPLVAGVTVSGIAGESKGKGKGKGKDKSKSKKKKQIPFGNDNQKGKGKGKGKGKRRSRFPSGMTTRKARARAKAKAKAKARAKTKTKTRARARVKGKASNGIAVGGFGGWECVGYFLCLALGRARGCFLKREPLNLYSMPTEMPKFHCVLG